MYDFLLVATVALFAAVVVGYLRHSAAALFHPATFYLAFHGLVFVVRPIFARVYDYQFIYNLYRFQPSLSDKITVLLGANLAMLVFVAVSLRYAGRPAQPVAASAHESFRRRMFGPAVVATLILGPIGILSDLFRWGSREGVYRSIETVSGTGVSINTSANGWFSEAGMLLAPLAIMLVYLSRYRPWGWAAFLVFAIMQAGVGFRGPLMYAAAAIAALFLLEHGRKWFDWRLIALALAALFAFNQIVTDRGATVRSIVGAAQRPQTTSEAELKPLEHMDFANLEFFEYVVYVVPQRSGSWDYFAQNLQIFTEPIPRVWWKNKPVGQPVKFFEWWDYGTPTGFTLSVPGTGWMEFGWFGIIVQASAFALLYAWFYRWLLTRRGDPLGQLAYAILIATAIVTFRDGSFVTFFRNLPFYIGPLLLAAWLLHRTTPRTGAHLRRARRAPAPVTPTERRRALAGQANHDQALRQTE